MRGGRILFTTRTLVIVCDLGFAPVISLGFDKTMDFGFALTALFVLLSATAFRDFARIAVCVLRDTGFDFAPTFAFVLLFVFAIINFLNPF